MGATVERLARDYEQLTQPPDIYKVTVVSGHGRVAFLDVAKGIGILLVVAGHCLRGLHDAGIVSETSLPWLIFYFIYCFHMPLFFFLSGCLVEARITTRPGHFLKSSLARIVYPYLLWGSIQNIVLILASGVINHPVSETAVYTLLKIIWIPSQQFWFLYVLFFMHMIALLTIVLGGRCFLMLVAAAAYALCAVSPNASNFISNYASGTNILFYVLGVCAGGSLLAWQDHIDRSCILVSISAIVLFAAVRSGWATHANFYSYVTLPGAFAGTAAIVLISRSRWFSDNRWLSYLGRLSMPIYVMHVLFASGARIVLAKAFHVSSWEVIFPVIFVAGVAGPLVVTRVACRLHLRAGLWLG